LKTKDNIPAEFDQFSKNYTADMIGCVPHYQALIEAISIHLPKTLKPARILDLGCGNGNIVSSLLEFYPNSEYTLVDASSDMIQLCKSRFSGYDMIYKECFFKDFQFKSSHYDLVVAGFSLHHCQKEEKKYLFQQIHKTLIQGGCFSTSDLMINKENPDHSRLVKEWGSFVNSNYPTQEKWDWIMDHYNTFDSPDNYNDQIKWLEEEGFESIKIRFRINYWANLLAIK
jgi:ubiquinone/menaquinone biosynthesis C-methylase UbiE